MQIVVLWYEFFHLNLMWPLCANCHVATWVLPPKSCFQALILLFWTCRACRSLICKLHTSVLFIRVRKFMVHMAGPYVSTWSLCPYGRTTPHLSGTFVAFPHLHSTQRTGRRGRVSRSFEPRNGQTVSFSLQANSRNDSHAFRHSFSFFGRAVHVGL